MTRWVIRTESDAAGPLEGSGGPDLPGSTGGLGMTWDVVADEVTAAWPDVPASADVVPLTPVLAVHAPLAGPRIKRTLLLRVRPGTPEDTVRRFEDALTAMPRHISSIHSWALSRTATGPWTHAWEQEFADLDGLNGEYLRHPYHWTCVDRWFDPESPISIVEPGYAHLFRWADGPVLC
ncbi:Dabb family protein [Nocardia sp. NEAU-G5]|uniref:Dabb family protein n=1 Tax=Nocardia albiluteola TaxID=2842303 RepID=A0ABS6B0R7_9NOCA|nr:Dabb family protein [Nocardia albiluteola]MBU3063890.1 Dabb family protein [Nocardia albiluteola]